jgi:hypothetical protein
MGKTVKIGPILSQIFLSIVAKQPIWEAPFARRFFPTDSNLVRKLKPLNKRVTSATVRNSQIAKSSSGQAGISTRK